LTARLGVIRLPSPSTSISGEQARLASSRDRVGGVVRKLPFLLDEPTYADRR
jgi:hypothetical protein